MPDRYTEDLRAAGQIARAVTGEPATSKLGHDGNWCLECQDGCGAVYGGVCACCSEWSREESDHG